MKETVHIEIGTRTIDFRINDTFVEYHPIFVRNELRSWESREKYAKLMKSLYGWQRDALRELMISELQAQYHHRRGQLISSSIDHCKKELIVCFSDRDVHKHVVKRFGVNVPKWHEFKAEWRGLM